MTFTEGPWSRHDTADYAEIHPATGKQHSAIALVGKPEDANLIAVAPEILAVLKLFVRAEKLARDGSPPQDADRLVELGDSVIARAECRA